MYRRNTRALLNTTSLHVLLYSISKSDLGGIFVGVFTVRPYKA